MISNRNTRTALRKPLIDALGGSVDLSIDNIYWENSSESTIQNLTLVEQLIPIDDKALANVLDGGSGLYQLSLYVDKDAGTEDAESICASICNTYIIGNIYTYANVSVIINESFVEATIEDSDYWVFPIRIDFRKIRELN